MFQKLAGGRVVLSAIPKPEKDDWGSLAEAFSSALELEKQVNQSLLDIHKVAGERGDPQVMHYYINLAPLKMPWYIAIYSIKN